MHQHCTMRIVQPGQGIHNLHVLYLVWWLLKPNELIVMTLVNQCFPWNYRHSLIVARTIKHTSKVSSSLTLQCSLIRGCMEYLAKKWLHYWVHYHPAWLHQWHAIQFSPLDQYPSLPFTAITYRVETKHIRGHPPTPPDHHYHHHHHHQSDAGHTPLLF